VGSSPTSRTRNLMMQVALKLDLKVKSKN